MPIDPDTAAAAAAAAAAKRELLRHVLATIAYRGGKAVRHAPEAFSEFRAAPDSRSAGEILAHIGDLLDWALSLARGKQVWNDSAPRAWDEDVRRFHDGLAVLEDYVSSDAPLAATPEKLFQGPFADALNHIGQIAMLRRLAGSPIRGENYHKADIAAGRVGADQAPARREFD